MGKKKRVCAFIDGSNFYHKLRSPKLDFSGLASFDYRGLINWLARDRQVAACSYYVGVVRAKQNDTHGQALRRKQQQLFSHLTSKEQNFTIQRGYLMENNGVYHEKGVDVQLAVDILVGAYEDLYDTAIIVSSDTDLIPAMEKAKSLGKEIEYIGFAHQPSLALQRYATISRLLIKEELKPFVCKEKTEKVKNVVTS